MARMAQRPPIGAILRDGMRRKSLDQNQVADAVGASRSAVNAWINGRAWPLEKFVAPLEDLLDVQLPRWWADEPGGEGATSLKGVDTDAREELHRSLDRMSGAELARLVEAWNAIKENGTGPRRDRAG